MHGRLVWGVSLMRKFALISLLVFLLTLSGCSRQRQFVGSWKDVNEDYTLYVDGSYIYDNISGQPMTYTRDRDGIVFVDTACDMVTTQLKFDGNNTVFLYINGRVREFERLKGEQTWSNLLNRDVEPGEFSRVFVRKSQTGPDFIDFSSNNLFTIQQGEQELEGAYMKSFDGFSVILYYVEEGRGLRTTTVLSSPGLDLLYGFELEKDGPLEVSAKRSSLTSDAPSGYLLDGIVGYQDSSTTFMFDMEGKCVKSSSNRDTVTYNYSVSSDGLITLGDEDGLLPEYDYMYYNVDSNSIYRVVFECSGWDEYLQQLLVQPTEHDLDIAISYSVSVPPTELIPTSLRDIQQSNPAYVWGSLEAVDAEYTSAACNQIAVKTESILSDDMARREYERSLMSEKERFMMQVRDQEKAYQRARAEMDAKMQAIIAEHQSSSSTPNYQSPYYVERSSAGYAGDTD